MIIDMTNVEDYIPLKEEGRFTLKVVEVSDPKGNKNGNPYIVVTVKDKEDRQHKEIFYVTDKALPMLKGFTKALKMPNVVDTNMMVGRYFECEMKKRVEDNEERYYITNFKESKLTNTLSPGSTTDREPAREPFPVIDVDVDENPFG